MVNVIDLKSDKTIASILDTKGVNGIAVANDINKAFISNGKDNSITVVNLKTFELLEKVKIAGVKPDAILYDQFFQKVFVYNAETNDATVIDAKTNKMVKTIPFGGKPEFSVTNTKKLIYVNIEDKNDKCFNINSYKYLEYCSRSGTIRIGNRFSYEPIVFCLQ